MEDILNLLESVPEPMVDQTDHFTLTVNESYEPGFTMLYSEEPRFAEKYLELFVSARLGGRYLRGLVEDHGGAYEDLNRSVRLVYVAESVEGWPTAEDLRQRLVEASVALGRDPESEFPLDYPDRVESIGDDFIEIGRFEGEGVDMVIFQRVTNEERVIP